MSCNIKSRDTIYPHLQLIPKTVVHINITAIRDLSYTEFNVFNNIVKNKLAVLFFHLTCDIERDFQRSIEKSQEKAETNWRCKAEYNMRIREYQRFKDWKKGYEDRPYYIIDLLVANDEIDLLNDLAFLIYDNL